MRTRLVALALVLASVGPLPGCASTASFRLSAARGVSPAAAPAPGPQLLTESPFRKPYERENLSEEVLQRVINAPVAPEFPARAGLVVLDAPFTRRAYSGLVPGDDAPQRLARRIERSRFFVMVSDIAPELADGQHLESLREVAARYRLKYLVVFSRKYVDRSGVNALGWTWLTVLGVPFVPAYTLRASVLAEATLLDVRTGTLLFSTQLHGEGAERTTPFAVDGKLKRLQQQVSRLVVDALAERFLERCRRLAAQEHDRSPAAAEGPGAAQRIF
ncbi:MAG: hypothetical protein IT371_24940 [Deltaproteobacteria bacterium]|nr:hypothetical protein [Deltaproteobacteria bacterium]